MQATHNTGKLKRDVLFKKLGFEEIGVNLCGVVDGYLIVVITDWIWREFISH